MNDIELLTSQSETLFVLDEAGRLLALNEPERPPAPYFFLGRSEGGNLWRCHTDLPAVVREKLSALAEAEPVGPVSQEPPRYADAFRKALEAHTDVRKVWSGPAYVFPEIPPMPAGVVKVTHENLPHLGEWVAWLKPCLADKEPCFVVVENARAVALCHSSRSSYGAAEAGLETLPAFRGRGYGTAVTLAWAHALLRAGRTPLYSTAWTNLASQGVARNLGLQLYGTNYHLS